MGTYGWLETHESVLAHDCHLAELEVHVALHVLHVLLQYHHVVGMLLARHVDAQISSDIGLVVAHITSP